MLKREFLANWNGNFDCSNICLDSFSVHLHLARSHLANYFHTIFRTIRHGNANPREIFFSTDKQPFFGLNSTVKCIRKLSRNQLQSILLEFQLQLQFQFQLRFELQIHLYLQLKWLDSGLPSWRYKCISLRLNLRKTCVRTCCRIFMYLSAALALPIVAGRGAVGVLE